MKNVSTGFGLCVLGLGIAAWPVLDRLMPQANAVGIGTTAVSAVAAAATAQGAPTIVWYGSSTIHFSSVDSAITLFRAWSDGKVEAKCGELFCGPNGLVWSPLSGGGGNNCGNVWAVVNNPAQGLTFDADLNFDEAVNGDDLGLLLNKWGPAPRNPVPPSDCPLALINP
jgi:hypothetical protein